MHCTLAIPELLEKIFHVLDDHCNFNNALVCRAWSEVALDALWREVYSLHQLFSLLAPLKRTTHGYYEFSRPLEYNDWLHFQRYSQRIWEFSYDNDGSGHTFYEHVFYDISRSRITLPILPNVHSLSWSSAILPCVLFMHSSVTCFTIHLPTTEPKYLRTFFSDIAARMHALTALDIGSCMLLKPFENEVVQLLSCLLRLKALTMPRSLFTTRITECISRLPELWSIDFTHDKEQGIGDPKDVAVFKPHISEGSFASLSDLSLIATYRKVAQLLTSPFFPSNLTLLYILSKNVESPTAIQQLVTTISKRCPKLSTLTLVSAPRTRGDKKSTTADTSQRVNMETLRPLCDCGNLTTLLIYHRFPLNLRQEDLDILAPRWSSLTELALNNEHLDIHSSNLTLEVLISFARHCPNLTGLGMFIDASSHAIPPFSATSMLPSFKNLRELCMGVSIIEEPAPVAMFLSRILPLGCVVNGGIFYWDEPYQVPHEAQGVFDSRSVLWNKVNKLLPLLTKARMEEREIIREAK